MGQPILTAVLAEHLAGRLLFALARGGPITKAPKRDIAGDDPASAQPTASTF